MSHDKTRLLKRLQALPPISAETTSHSEKKGCHVHFKFSPGDYVNVTFLGLNYNGRVKLCEYDGARFYHVEYADDVGKLERKPFHEDEIELKKEAE